MNICYIANIRLPTEKAHGAQIMQMCEAFARAGHEVELVVPTRRTALREDPFVYYGIKPLFSITTLASPDLVSFGRLGFVVQSLLFGMRALWYTRSRPGGVLYGRDELVLAVLALARSRRIVWETHTGAWNVAARVVAHRSAFIITISHRLKRWYVAKGIAAQKLLVAPDGVDLTAYAHPQANREARTRLALPLDTPIVLYVGRVDGWKGVDTLCEASKLLPESVQVVIIGGEPTQVAALGREYPRVHFLGYLPMRELPDNLAVADVLVLPNTGRQQVSAEFTSPLKLFAYMASGKPIVASDLPSIREVLDDASAVLVPADTPAALAEAITELLSDAPRAAALAHAARARVERYTWDARALAVCSALTHYADQID